MIENGEDNFNFLTFLKWINFMWNISKNLLGIGAWGGRGLFGLSLSLVFLERRPEEWKAEGEGFTSLEFGVREGDEDVRES